MRLYAMGAVRLVMVAGLTSTELVIWFERARRMRLAAVANDNAAAPAEAAPAP